MKIAKYRKVIVGSVVGAICGYAYYFFVGCVSGTCVITSNPVITTLYGMLAGGLLADTLRKNGKLTEQEK